ncbi:ATP-binding cassette domain-containing protein [Mycoplasma anatis]|uniref:ATP-binding cassette domain-containing protein n=1 Tax=Mycoplasmopsis anatis TaxID=171279 RepID=A0A9Q3L7X1_9BACT|nr:ABC transporter ATP-binding protein [Mycoplasmopsis anatis]MBW0602362.1 ATP-binding cassette domain-containing protein [Mycoplasmopsis anatis]MBW0603876.1 ATP-binding cassette domain-containing protein [Mycoplasmopsis anatis]
MIELKNISKKFNDQVIFNNLNIKFPKNKLIFITGRSGSGKTTLLNLILGIETLDSGEIYIGEEKLKLNEYLKSKKIDCVFQSYNLVENISAMDNILIANQIINRNISKKEIVKLAKKLDISEEILNKEVSKLSGGQKQRIAILRSITRDSEIILCDEPTGNLDQNNSDEVFKILSSLKSNKTIIVITHDIKAPKKYGDYIYDLEKNIFINNEIIETENKEISNEIKVEIKNSKWKPTLKLVWSDYKKKFVLFILLMFSFVFSTLFISTSNNLIHINENMVQSNVNKTNLDEYNLTKKNKAVFSNEEIEYIKNNFNVSRIVEEYKFGDQYYLVSYNDHEILINNLEVEGYDNIDYHRNNVKLHLNKEIKFLQENEIILSSDIVSKLKLKPEDLIGNKIKIYNHEFTVVDINYSTSLNYHFYLSFINPDLKLKLVQEHFLIDGWYTLTYFSNSQIIDIKITNFLNNSNLTITNGREIQNNDEILISSAIYNSNIKLNSEFLIQAPSKNIYAKIVGVFESDKNEIAGSKQFLENIDKVQTNFLKIYSDDTEITSKLQNTNYLYNISKPSTLFLAKVLNNSLGLHTALKYVSLSISLISFLILVTTGKMLNDSKTKDIGVFKVLGAKNFMCISYHITSLILILLVTGIISFSLYYPVHLWVSSYIEVMEFQINFDWAYNFTALFVSWISLSIISVLIYAMISIFKFNTKTANLLK